MHAIRRPGEGLRPIDGAVASINLRWLLTERAWDAVPATSALLGRDPGEGRKQGQAAGPLRDELSDNHGARGGLSRMRQQVDTVALRQSPPCLDCFLAKITSSRAEAEGFEPLVPLGTLAFKLRAATYGAATGCATAGHGRKPA